MLIHPPRRLLSWQSCVGGNHINHNINGRNVWLVERPSKFGRSFNGYEVSGKKLEDFLMMIDQGMINEAENQLLDNIDYSDKENVAAAALFYQ